VKLNILSFLLEEDYFNAGSERKGGKRNILKVYSFYDLWCWEEKKGC
jgi:hypothetical protein